MNSLSINILAAIATTCLLVSCVAVNTQPDMGEVRFGLMHRAENGELELVRETLTIPLKLRDPDYAFGYVYCPNHTNEYRIHDISYMPSSPTTLSGEISILPVGSATKGLKTPEYTMHGVHQMEYWFDEGDPLGNYRIDVVVNDHRVRSIRFKVVQDK